MMDISPTGGIRGHSTYLSKMRNSDASSDVYNLITRMKIKLVNETTTRIYVE